MNNRKEGRDQEQKKTRRKEKDNKEEKRKESRDIWEIWSLADVLSASCSSLHKLQGKFRVYVRWKFVSKLLKAAESSLCPMQLPHGQEAPAKLRRDQAWLVSLYLRSWRVGKVPLWPWCLVWLKSKLLEPSKTRAACVLLLSCWLHTALCPAE